MFLRGKRNACLRRSFERHFLKTVMQFLAWPFFRLNFYGFSPCQVKCETESRVLRSRVYARDDSCGSTVGLLTKRHEKCIKANPVEPTERKDAMKFFALCIVTLALAIVGCHNSNTDTTPTKEQSNSLTVYPGGQSVQSTETLGMSDYELCMRQNRGMPTAADFCTQQIQARAPGQMPRYPYGYGYGYSYGGYGMPLNPGYMQMPGCVRRVQTATGVYCY